MLARDKGNFHAQGKNQTRDPPVQWLEHPISRFLTPQVNSRTQISHGQGNERSQNRVRSGYEISRDFDSRPGYENFRCPGRAWFLLLSS